jgi:hypothetical protein
LQELLLAWKAEFSWGTHGISEVSKDSVDGQEEIDKVPNIVLAQGKHVDALGELEDDLILYGELRAEYSNFVIHGSCNKPEFLDTPRSTSVRRVA